MSQLVPLNFQPSTLVFQQFFVQIPVVLLSTHAQSFEKSSHKLFASTKLKKADEQKVKTFMQATTPEDFDDLEFDETAHYDEPGVVPELPLIKLFNDSPLEVGQSLTIGCLSRNGDPTADLSWHLNNQQLNETVLDFEETGDDRSTSNTLSVIQWNVKVEDDGKILTCQARHPGYLKGFVETKHKLNIKYAPTKQPLKVIGGVKIGESVDISVSFRSNPKPTTIKWLVGDTKIYYGAVTQKNGVSKCVSREIKAIGHNFWSASLHIANVTDDDIASNYKLQVRNPIGSADYVVQLEGAQFDINHYFNELLIVMNFFSGKRKLNQTKTEAAVDNILTTTEVPDESTTLIEELDDQTTVLSVSTESDVEEQTTHLIDENEMETTTSEPFDATTESSDLDPSEAVVTENVESGTVTDELETKTEAVTKFDNAEGFTVETAVPSKVLSEASLDVQPTTPQQETKNDKVGLKTKVSKIIIFKRPIFNNSGTSDQNSKAYESEHSYGYGLNFVQSSITEVAAKAILFWKTSLLIILSIVLILSFTYHRRRIMKLKAEIIQKNLGINQSASTFAHSSNAYTPTYFARRLVNDHKLPITLSDYDSSSRSRSNLYSPTYNSSCHSYESIIDLHSNNELFDADQMRKKRIDEDVESGEHIYAEIPWKTDPAEEKISDDESNSATSSE